MGIALERAVCRKDRPQPPVVAPEEPDQPLAEPIRSLPQGDGLLAQRGSGDRERVTQIQDQGVNANHFSKYHIPAAMLNQSAFADADTRVSVPLSSSL